MSNMLWVGILLTGTEAPFDNRVRSPGKSYQEKCSAKRPEAHERILLHSRKLTWKPKKGPLKTTVLLNGGYMGFHVSLGECTSIRNELCFCSPMVLLVIAVAVTT